jgi:diguanylate cyclase (GGDEF)-like protein
MEKATILTVDDIPLNVRIINSILKESYEIVAATSYNSALQILETMSEKIDLILLDIIMPNGNGYDLCKKLKSDPKFEGIPIIFLTSQTDEKDESYGFEIGAVDYVTKPVNPLILKARVRTQIELKKQRDLLLNLSTMDELTGIVNRRYLDKLLLSEWGRSTRAINKNVSEECEILRLGIAMVDIDYFKKYNDHYGHGHGDECLKQVAFALKSNLYRVNDEVGRYGGEEFVVILPQVTHEGAVQCANKLKKAIENLQIPHEKSEFGYVTISTGLATIIPGPFGSYKTTLEAADKMLYTSKESGRNRVSAVYLDAGDLK